MNTRSLLAPTVAALLMNACAPDVPQRSFGEGAEETTAGVSEGSKARSTTSATSDRTEDPEADDAESSTPNAGIGTGPSEVPEQGCDQSESKPDRGAVPMALKIGTTCAVLDSAADADNWFIDLAPGETVSVLIQDLGNQAFDPFTTSTVAMNSEVEPAPENPLASLWTLPKGGPLKLTVGHYSEESPSPSPPKALRPLRYKIVIEKR